MPESISIAMRVQDNVSAAIAAMKQSVTSFRGDITALQGALNRLSATRVELRMDLSVARREAQQAKNAVEALGKSVSQVERKAAEADWRKARENLENVRRQYEEVSRQVHQTTQDMERYNGTIRRAENRAEGGSGSGDSSSSKDSEGKGVLSGLDKSKLLDMAGDAVVQWAGTLASSALGSQDGNLVSGALSGAISGATMGASAGPIGIAVGAAIGGGIGLITGAAKNFAEEDEAFKSYYKALYDAGEKVSDQRLEHGSALAAQRDVEKGIVGTGQSFTEWQARVQSAKDDLDASGGEGYNTVRTQGMKEEAAAYEGPLGEALKKVNEVEGENAAYLKNLSERYTREALSAVLLGETSSDLFDPKQQAKLEDMRSQYIDASAAYENGDQEAGLVMESLREQAEAMAAAAYESSEQYQTMHQVELDEIEAIRNLTEAMDGWRNGFEIKIEQSKGRIAGKVDNLDISTTEEDGTDDGERIRKINAFRYAVGLNRVPYDEFPALLHEGERVLTAQEARAEDRGRAPLQITITGNTFGAGVTPEEIAQRLADALERKLAAGVLA